MKRWQYDALAALADRLDDLRAEATGLADMASELRVEYLDREAISNEVSLALVTHTDARQRNDALITMVAMKAALDPALSGAGCVGASVRPEWL